MIDTENTWGAPRAPIKHLDSSFLQAEERRSIYNMPRSLILVARGKASGLIEECDMN